jgi:hypothetical protein
VFVPVKFFQGWSGICAVSLKVLHLGKLPPYAPKLDSPEKQARLKRPSLFSEAAYVTKREKKFCKIDTWLLLLLLLLASSKLTDSQSSWTQVVTIKPFAEVMLSLV